MGSAKIPSDHTTHQGVVEGRDDLTSLIEDRRCDERSGQYIFESGSYS